MVLVRCALRRETPLSQNAVPWFGGPYPGFSLRAEVKGGCSSLLAVHALLKLASWMVFLDSPPRAW